MGAHALLSPSSAHRWLNCTAAPRLEALEPDKATDFALEGSLAHALGARKLKVMMGEDTASEETEIAELRDRFYCGEMEEHTDFYFDLVNERFAEARATTPDARLLIETRLDFSEYVPESFGTADAVIIADGCMEVIDFKYGRGVEVHANHNPQMMIYALGAFEAFSFEYNIDRVRMTICQPRKNNVSTWEIALDHLLAWARDVLSPKAREAMSGEGAQAPGDWCQFCRVKGRCRALAAHCSSATLTDPALLSPEEIAANVLPRLPMIKAWLSSVEEHTLQQALNGVAYPGYKLVEGRSVRRVSDVAGLLAVLRKEGYPDADLVKPTELRTLTELEKLCGRKHFAELSASFITKPAGKPTLVVATDRRPEWNSAAADFKDF